MVFVATIPLGVAMLCMRLCVSSGASPGDDHGRAIVRGGMRRIGCMAKMQQPRMLLRIHAALSPPIQTIGRCWGYKGFLFNLRISMINSICFALLQLRFVRHNERDYLLVIQQICCTPSISVSIVVYYGLPPHSKLVFSIGISARLVKPVLSLVCAMPLRPH